MHFHIIQRMPDQLQNRQGTQIFEKLGEPTVEWVSQEGMNAITVKVRERLLAEVLAHSERTKRMQ